MRRGVGDRDAAAVREAEQVYRLGAEMLAQGLHVADVRRERVVLGGVRAERSARAEQHELKRVVEAGEVAEFGGRPARAARMADKERPAPSPFVREREPVRRGE